MRNAGLMRNYPVTSYCLPFTLVRVLVSLALSADLSLLKKGCSIKEADVVLSKFE